MRKPPRILKRATWWATVRPDGSVCLWETRQQAQDGKEPDERVTRVRLSEVTK